MMELAAMPEKEHKREHVIYKIDAKEEQYKSEMTHVHVVVVCSHTLQKTCALSRKMVKFNGETRST